MLAALTVLITFNVAGLPNEPTTIHRVVPNMAYCRELGWHVMESNSDAHRYEASCANLPKDTTRRLWEVY